MRNSTSSCCAGLAALLVSVIALGGCAASGPAFQRLSTTNEEAAIYVFREGGMISGTMSWTLFVNGEQVTTLAGAGYYSFAAGPGRVVFHAVRSVDQGVPDFVRQGAAEGSLFILDAEPGREYILKFEAAIDGPRLQPAPLDVGLEQLRVLRRFAPAMAN